MQQKKLEKAVELQWDRVDATLIYNIYMNNQLIGMSENENYVHKPEGYGLINYRISACSEFSGEGEMSDTAVIEIPLHF